ncbi:FtsX-like permease family protein [Candidatus Bathyarchaeota archaeon]|nr:FtsX-like permease family protein [Candidatus Bathyarchaeota archaeon]
MRLPLIQRREHMARLIAAALLTMIILSLTASTPAAAADMVDIKGTVTERLSGEPIQGARVELSTRRYWRRYSSQWDRQHTLTTDASGGFTASLEEGTQYRVIVYHKDGGAVDYVPYGSYITPSEGEDTLDVRLWAAAEIEVKGLAYFIETTSIPSTTFRLVNVSSGESVKSGGIALSYGSYTESFSGLIGIPGDTVIAPSGTPLRLQVISNVNTRSQSISRGLEVDEFLGGLAEGEHVEVDLRRHVLPESIGKMVNRTEGLGALLIEKEEDGFFLAIERQRLSRVSGLVSEAETLMEMGEYEASFTSLREAYVELTDVLNGVNGLVGDAAASTYLLILFTAVAGFIVSSLLYESTLLKAIGSAVVNALLLLALAALHPGAALVSQRAFATAAVASYAAVNAAAYLAPGLLSSGGGSDGVPLSNLLVPIFSVAKRSLRRRWMRFGLTLISVLMLVASFISLTSFSSGYGLSFAKQSSGAPLSEGVLIRTPNPPPARAAAPFCGGEGAAGPVPVEDRVLTWFAEDAEPLYVVPKYCNQPERQYREANNPFGRLDGVPVFGVMAVAPSLEAEINGLDGAVVSGRYLGDDEENTVLISESMALRLEKTVGDTVTLKALDRVVDLEVVGLLGDDEFAAVTDLDGEPIIPQKIIELERVEMDGPDFVVEGLAYCDPGEVVVVNMVTGSGLSCIWINRVNLVFEDGYDLMGFASSTALNRGFRVWASAGGSVYLAQLAGYFQGKGLPILIPWMIVVLNVVVTMLNSYYERRHEIAIYSSIGMNPSQISGIFLAEAAVIGVIGGCLGYMLGLGAYRFIYLVTPTLQVKQKVSAFWSLAAIGMSLTAVLMGGVVAIRNSTVITPSLRRKWKAERSPRTNDPFTIRVPVHVYEEEIDAFMAFLIERLNEEKRGIDLATRMIKVNETVEPRGWEITFNYGSVDPTIAAIYTKNRLTVALGGDGTYGASLECIGEEEGVRRTGQLMRRIGLDWSVLRAVETRPPSQDVIAEED